MLQLLSTEDGLWLMQLLNRQVLHLQRSNTKLYLSMLQYLHSKTGNQQPMLGILELPTLLPLAKLVWVVQKIIHLFLMWFQEPVSQGARLFRLCGLPLQQREPFLYLLSVVFDQLSRHLSRR